MDPNRAPTMAELDAADEYAARKLCLEIPGQFTGGLTSWDDRRKKCTITKGGCGATSLGPISVNSFSINGTLIDWEKMNVGSKLDKFWRIHPPQHLAWKKIKGSTEFGCSRANFKFQQFCQFPAQRNSKNEDAFNGNVGKGQDNVPPFEYVIKNGVETCIIGKDYCDAKGVSYDPIAEECYISGYQQFQEFMYGTTLVREMKMAGFP